MTTALPPEVKYGTVKGKFIQAVVDSPSDPDTFPDAKAQSGVLTFTAGASQLLFPSSNPPVTIFPLPIPVPLENDGTFQVDLVANKDNADMNPPDWNWTVSFALDGISKKPFPLDVVAGQTADITLLVPVTASAGTLITQGPPGPAGEGIAAGGLTGQVLAKVSGADYDTGWIDLGQLALPDTIDGGSPTSTV